MEHHFDRMENRDSTDETVQNGENVATPKPVPLLPRDRNERLSLQPSNRVTLGIFSGLLVGMGAGFIRGFRVAELRFRAENAHRMPKSEKGWFFYHRSKTHYSVLAGMKMSAKTGVVFSLMSGMFLTLEDQFDNIRGGQSKDCISTIMAGTITGGLYSLAKRHTMSTAGRTLTAGFKGGFAYGLIQDALSLAQGRRLGYVEQIKQLLGFRSP